MKRVDAHQNSSMQTNGIPGVVKTGWLKNNTILWKNSFPYFGKILIANVRPSHLEHYENVKKEERRNDASSKMVLRIFNTSIMSLITPVRPVAQNFYDPKARYCKGIA